MSSHLEKLRQFLLGVTTYYSTEANPQGLNSFELLATLSDNMHGVR